MRWFCFEGVREWVIFESSKARMIPRVVIMIAAVFVIIGMVIGGVFVGRIRDEISNPAAMLPRASRMTGRMADGVFSLIGKIVRVRLYPVWTSSVMRRL